MKTKHNLKSHSQQLDPMNRTKSKMFFNREERSKSAESQKDSSRKSFVEGRATDFSKKPSPLDFEAFLPWICVEWQCLKTVIVTKGAQEPYKKKEKKYSSSRSRGSKILKLKNDENETGVRDSKVSTATYGMDSGELKLKSVDSPYADTDNLSVKAVYDTKDRLVEVAIIKARNIPHEVIKAIALCLPFHPLITKLTISGGGVSSPLLLEIAELLGLSNITDVNLENCFVPEGNFYILLEQTRLKYLCLSRCHINDIVCDKLVSKIEFGAPCSSMLILDLGSNFITDVGAERIGQVLRLNRTLLHLNLSNNQITDVGAAAILSSLAEFPLTADEIIDKSRRKFKYAKNKIAIYKNFLKEVLRTSKRFEVASSDDKRSTTKMKPTKKEKPNKFSSPVTEKSAAAKAEKMTTDFVGDFVDPFDSKGITIKNDLSYGVGNLILCSLNLSYNMITFETVKRIYEVLKYQEDVFKAKPQTGLMRILFEGNNIPVECIEYRKIEELLKSALYEDVAEQAKSHKPSFMRKIKTSVFQK